MRCSRRTLLTYAATAGVSLLLPACRPAPAPRPQADVASADGALRLEFRHFIANGDERFALARVRFEPSWGGPRTRVMPDWGDYRLSLFAREGGALLFRTGYDSRLERDAASAATRLVVRIPVPARIVDAVIERRRAGAVFQPVWNGAIDPADDAIDRSPRALHTRVDTIVSNGEPSAKADIAILGDGYLESHYPKFVADARRACDYLFSVDPFRRRLRDFNVHAVFVASPESGVTDPYLGLQRRTAFRCAYSAGEAERTLAVTDESALREAASAVPYDFLLVIANARRYGGSAYFGGPAVVSIDSAAARYLVLHEFAHVIGGLADEYYLPGASGPAYAGNIEPWNPNVTISAQGAKWQTRGSHPAQWNKAEYDRYFAGYVRRYFALRAAHAGESAVDAFMQDESRRQAALLAKNPKPDTPGLFEGANGYAKGVYRSEVDCVMFSLQTRRFCRACAAAIDLALDAHTAIR